MDTEQYNTKPKKVLILFNNHGEVSNQAYKEIVYKKTVNDILSEERYAVESISSGNGERITYFNDGTSVILKPISNYNYYQEQKFTHFLIDNSVLQLGNGKELVKELIKYYTINKDNYSYDTSGNQFSMYSVENGMIIYQNI